MRMENWLYSVPLRFRSLFRRARVEQELEEELQYHLERKTEEYLAQGMTPEQARQAALRSMDGLTQRREECRDMRGVSFLENTIQDIRYGLRVLAKSPGFTAVAVVTLALGIGANAVVFGVLNALILRPINVPRAEDFYGIQRGDEHFSGQSYPDYLDMRDRNRSFDGLAAYSFAETGLDTGQNPSRSWAQALSGNYFDILGIQPYLGRLFHRSDEHGQNSAPYIVLSYDYWHNHFSDDRGAVGRVVRLNKHPFTIIGVAPPEFHGTLLFFFPDFYVPMVNLEQVDGSNNFDARGSRWVFMVMGHLKAGVTREQAVADLNSIGGWLAKNYPKDDGPVSFSLVRPGLYGDFLGRPVRAFVTALMLLAGLILLAACANLGSLFAARAADRGREVALRLALGATRSRILRGLFTESVMIALMGGAAGLAGSVMLLRALSVWRPLPRFPIHVPVHPDARVYGIALLLALVSGILFGIVPVRQVLRSDPYQIIKAGPTATVGRRITVRDLLLVVQVAICAVLVTSSMVALRGLTRSLSANYGFEPRNAMLVNTDLKMAGYSGEQIPAMQKRMIDAMKTIPSVKSVGVASVPPLDQAVESSLVYADEATDMRPSQAAARAMTFSVSPEYFQAAGTALLSGRIFTWHDDKNAPRVAIINREFARKALGRAALRLGRSSLPESTEKPGQTASRGDPGSSDGAIGKYFKLRSGSRIQVVGIAEDGKYTSLTEEPRPAMFLPILQSPASESFLVVRTDRDPRPLAGSIRTALRELDAELPAFMQTWEQNLGGALFPSMVATVSLGVMGLMGAMLAVTGIFGMAAYSVSRRLRELGIRIALGAQGKEVLQAALGRALKLLALGSVSGMLLGILASRVLALIVYEATPRDPLVLAGVVVSMSALGLAATWIPARRAMSVDPVRLLREE
jgi:predicted permease